MASIDPGAPLRTDAPDPGHGAQDFASTPTQSPVASRETPSSKTEGLPFGALTGAESESADPAAEAPRTKRPRRRRSSKSKGGATQDEREPQEQASGETSRPTETESAGTTPAETQSAETQSAKTESAETEDGQDEQGGKRDWRSSKRKRGGGRRGGRRRTRSSERRDADEAGAEADSTEEPGVRRHNGAAADREPAASDDEAAPADAGSSDPAEPRAWATRKGGRRSRGKARLAAASMGAAPATSRKRSRSDKREGGKERDKKAGGRGSNLCEGILITDKGGHGKLRRQENGYLPDRKEDVHVGPRMIQKHKLREGSVIKGRFGRGMGKHKWDLVEVTEVDGRKPAEAQKFPEFKRLTSIDPDFHYELGDFTEDTSMRVVDLICPIGRGQRGLIVAPPRSGKTILLQKIAKGVEEHYPEVKLMVLLSDERPEEATEWKRSIKGDVFVSTNDELPKVHVELAEVVWKRCMRLVELGEDVVLLLDSITRLARAYNHVHGTSGKTMSGGLDAKAMERPKMFFGAARNTESAGSLTILGTTLIETGSLMDKMIFEEFKGTGNMELVLSRKLADRRIFPAIDVERSGTRKEEKLISSQRLRRITVLRRVLARMNFIEAMELLITKLDDVERNDDFLKRFDIDPDAS